MITVEEASRLIQRQMPDYGLAVTHLGESQNRVLAEDIFADREYPPFHRVMMDGIAVNFHLFREGKREFRIEGICPAGNPSLRLENPGACFEIMTGAPLPEGADLVIPYEHLTIENGIARVTTEIPRSQMENVHLRGSDTKTGELVLETGTSLNGPHWGIATSVGKEILRTKKLPRINIISTGDELVEAGAVPEIHQIRKSNVHALKASLGLAGYQDVSLSHLRDDPSAIEDHYQSAKAEFDILIYSGGVSKGKFDYLPTVWKKLGVKEVLHGISQRPGKPLWFGVDETERTVVFGLPGNPVSSLVCLHRYFLPQREIYAVLSEEIVFRKDLTYFLPVRLEFTKSGSLIAHPVSMKNSGEFTALAGTDGFLELPKEQEVFKAGEVFRYFSWRPL